MVTNAALSPVHQRNLEQALDARIATRADLIFSIFERNASSSEGRLQVELARLNYELPRLTGVGKELSRTGGDLGTRGGGGEPITVLTKDRIRRRIRKLEGAMDKLKRVRELRRKQRLRTRVFTVSLIGYTNSGKSLLINALTGSSEEVAQRYFTTLDPAARSLYLGEGINAVACDTVGFLDDLPAELAAAFSATMEEVGESDLLLHVVDAARENVEFRIESGTRILADYGLAGIPRIVVFNKVDLLDDLGQLNALQEAYPESVAVSAATGEGLPELLRLLAERAKVQVGF